MLDYLMSHGYTESYEAFRKEANVLEDVKQKGLLEKKWTSIVRMHRKVCLIEPGLQPLYSDNTCSDY